MSSSTATLPLPAATPHLRAVRSTTPIAERRYPAASPYATPVAPQHPAPIPPQYGTVPQVLPQPAVQPAPAALVEGLPAGATVVAALPQSAIPQGLLAQYGAQFGEAAAAAQPLVGYLVLVPAEPAQRPAGHSHPGVGHPQPAAHQSGAQAQPTAAAPQSAGKPDRGRGIAVDTERRNAWVDGRQLELTYLEFELLAHLTEHPQRVHTRDQLVSAVWGYGHVGDGRTVDVHVARLRRKLGAAYRDSIVTVRRVGYKYTPVS
ncbi:transcriptional regulator [Kitasatospora sp. MMS16-BH015]|uniref:winged helix-turn-helix domain-containing protein n=1 Tax=Kitasatospora sp. MMS16-BH015 TaxID=2018025 RepID=UPI000CA2CB4E|nr:winged helix family transcriptional regulator [Kitasatospora sp. MMS16-BH015]AUG80935.1 transcriptional regulator [Kitasatospora sp. MMS16-BH015]